MATYVYKNSAGETREIVASMKNPPPEYVYFPDESDIWLPQDEKSGARNYLDRFWHRFHFRRDYSNSLPMVNVALGGGVEHPHQKNRLPTSVVLPRATGGNIVNRGGTNVREIKPGLYATMDGKRIVDSNRSADRHAADCGYVRSRDA